MALTNNNARERPSPACNDQVQGRMSLRCALFWFERFVSGVVMQVASENGADLSLLARRLANPREGSVRRFGPIRRVQNNDDLRVRFFFVHFLDDCLEIFELCRVNAVA